MPKRIFSILIVDDNTNNLHVLADVLSVCGYEIGLAMSGKEAIEYVKSEKPDLILLDVMMPDIDGYETCTILKRDPESMDIPIMFLTAKTDTEDIIKGFNAGGVDYISKPFNSEELKSRVSTHLRLKDAQDELRKSFDELREAKNLIEIQNQKLNEVMIKLEEYSLKDHLTNLSNRRAALNIIGEQAELFKNSKKKFTLVMGDIDHFKNINDTYGHDAGDEVLKKLATIFVASVRKADMVSRWGGEEFLIMLTGTDSENSVNIMEKIRESVNIQKFIFDDQEVSVTITFGISEFHEGDNIEEVIKRADIALYNGKNSGRNKVVVV